jgi:hypothetical protein
MRARLIMKLMGIMMMLVLTIITAKGCSGSGSASSPLDPTNLAHNGLAGLCANQQAADEASGDPTQSQTNQTILSPTEAAGLDQSNPGGVAALQQALGGNFSCTTTTVAGGGQTVP